jgi:hypothetical protein
MRTDWRGYLNTPMEIVEDYLTVMAGEAKRDAPKGKQAISDAPLGFDMETETEVIAYRVPDAPKS